MGKIKVIGYCNPSYSRVVRIEQVFKYLNKTGDFTCIVSPNGINDQELMWADIIVAQGTVDPRMIADLWAYKVERRKIVIADRDDVSQVTVDNPHAKLHSRLHAASWTDQLVKIASLVTVTNTYLRKHYSQLNADTFKLPNYLDMTLWDVPSVPNETGMVRIGWAGSASHREDVRMILPIVKETLKKNKNVKFVFSGDPTFVKDIQDVDPQQWEYRPATLDFYSWPAIAQTLSLDIALAPLVDNDFNKGRSPLKFLEYSMIGAAGIFSPVAYSGIVSHNKTGLIANTANEWRIYLEELIENKAKRNFISLKAKEYVRRNYSIERNIRKWSELYQRAVQECQ